MLQLPITNLICGWRFTVLKDWVQQSDSYCTFQLYNLIHPRSPPFELFQLSHSFSSATTWLMVGLLVEVGNTHSIAISSFNSFPRRVNVESALQPVINNIFDIPLSNHETYPLTHVNVFLGSFYHVDKWLYSKEKLQSYTRHFFCQPIWSGVPAIQSML